MKNDQKATILNVDGDDSGRYAVTRILRLAGFDVREASNGRDALQLAEEQPDLILLDVNLPDIGGFDVCMIIKNNPITSHIPVLHLSATYMDDESKVRGLEIADGYLTQPVGPQVLISTIKTLLRMKRAEKELRESEEHYRILFDEALDGICLADAETGIIMNCNQAMAALVARERAELIGRPQKILHPPQDDQETVSPTFKQHLVDKQGQILETQVVTRQGDIREVEIKANLLDIRGRKLLQGIFRDITERKRAEETLRETLQRLKYHVENSPLAVVEFNKDFEIIHWSNKAERVFGWNSEEVLGKRIDQLRWVHEDDVQRVTALSEDMFASHRTSNIHTNRNYRKDGSVITCEWYNSALVDATGNLVSVQSLVLDITERKRMEEELLRAQKLESVGVLAGGIAHDFNNILTVILGNVSLAKMRVSHEDKIFGLLSEAETASVSAQTLTRQLLTFAKGGALVKETASIKDIIKESSFFVLRGSKSRCKFSIAEDLWPAEVDVGQISQVINNIVINANQAMPEGGIIQVAAENLIIDVGHILPLKPGRYIRISITDQGVGIAEKHLLHIFDPYFTTKQKGSGLGLATTYSIIKKHDGHITVESGLGESTTFHIYLPASEKAGPEKEEARLIKGHGRILVMDDEEMLREVMGKMLEILGYESEFAKDGAEAIQMYKAARKSGRPYDAVILDLTVPGGMGGKDTVKKLLKIDPEIKAIVSSGYSDDPVLSNFQEYGFKGMMPKPFESRLLSKVLHEVLQGKKE